MTRERTKNSARPRNGPLPQRRCVVHSRPLSGIVELIKSSLLPLILPSLDSAQRSTGSNRRTKNRRKAVPRVFRADRRGRPRGLPVRDPLRAPPEKETPLVQVRRRLRRPSRRIPYARFSFDGSRPAPRRRLLQALPYHDSIPSCPQLVFLPGSCGRFPPGASFFSHRPYPSPSTFPQ